MVFHEEGCEEKGDGENPVYGYQFQPYDPDRGFEAAEGENLDELFS